MHLSRRLLSVISAIGMLALSPQAYAQSGTEENENYFRLMQSTNPAERVQGADGLASRGIRATQQAVPYLLQGLQDTDPSVRVASINALGAMRYEAQRATPYLIQSLSDPDPQIRDAAATSLTSIGNREGREAVANYQRSLNATGGEAVNPGDMPLTPEEVQRKYSIETEVKTQAVTQEQMDEIQKKIKEEAAANQLRWQKEAAAAAEGGQQGTRAWLEQKQLQANTLNPSAPPEFDMQGYEKGQLKKSVDSIYNPISPYPE